MTPCWCAPAPGEPDDELTVVRPAPGAGVGTGHGVGTTTGGSVAMPVEDPEVSARSLGTGALPGLDPERRIAPVPGSMPWDALPEPERGVRPGAPIVYGARSEHANAAQVGTDEVHRLLGDPPAVAPVPVRAGRSALPSMERRARSLRLRTLLCYAGVGVVAVLGLWGVAVLAFG